MDTDEMESGEEIIKEEDIDWNSLLEPFDDFLSHNITSAVDGAGQGGGNMDSSVLGKQKNRISFSQRLDDGGIVETEESKIKRTGSLNRILVASRSMSMTVATTDAAVPFLSDVSDIFMPPAPSENISLKPTLTKAAPLPNRITALENKFKVPTNPMDVVLKIIHTFNAGDIEALSNIVRHSFSNECLYYSDAMSNVLLKGKTDIMMYMALQIELYPDGIWILGNNVSTLEKEVTNKEEGTIVTEFTFSGTRVFNKTTKELFDHIKQEDDVHEKSSVLIGGGIVSSIGEPLTEQCPCYNVEKLGKLLETAFIADANPSSSSVSFSDSSISNTVSENGSVTSGTHPAPTLTSTNLAAISAPLQLHNHYRKLVFHFNYFDLFFKLEAFGDL